MSRKSVPQEKLETRRPRTGRVGPDALVWAAGRQPGWPLFGEHPNRKASDSSRIRHFLPRFFVQRTSRLDVGQCHPISTPILGRGTVRETVKNDSATFRARSQAPRPRLPRENNCSGALLRGRRGVCPDACFIVLSFYSWRSFAGYRARIPSPRV
jgi:hypothetical protein